MHAHYVNRQPIIDHEGNIFAYDIHYSSLESTSNQHELISSFLLTLLNTYGINNILGGKPGFLQIDHTVLMSELMELIPKEHFIFAILSTTIIDAHTYNKILNLSQQGYRFALHDIDLQSVNKLQTLKRLFPLIDYLKINGKLFSEPYLAKLNKIMKIYDVELIATDVESNHIYEMCAGIPIYYIQGDYFAEPVTLKQEIEDPKIYAVVHLYNQLMSDVEIHELVETFERNHELTLQLISYVNSLNFHLTHEVSSIQQVLTLLGRKPLAQWLMLMIYGKSINKSKAQSALLSMVQNRSELMENLYQLINPNDSKEAIAKARFTAILSLSSAVMSVPLTIILRDINVSEEIKSALLDRTGMLGELLDFVKAIEKYDVKTMHNYFTHFNLTPSRVFEIMAKSLVKVTKSDQNALQ